MTLNMEEAKAHLKDHGWVGIPSVLSKEEAEDALDRLWKARSASEASGDNTFQPILDPNPTRLLSPRVGCVLARHVSGPDCTRFGQVSAG